IEGDRYRLSEPFPRARIRRRSPPVASALLRRCSIASPVLRGAFCWGGYRLRSEPRYRAVRALLEFHQFRERAPELREAASADPLANDSIELAQGGCRDRLEAAAAGGEVDQ